MRDDAIHDQNARRNQAGASAGKSGVKILKHAAFIFLSWNFAIAFMCYFIPTREMLHLVPFFEGDLTALVWSLFWTGLMYFDYSWFREQTCLIICPYGRLQSTLVDYDTVIIGYDEKRGEPRARGVDEGGDCIDCFRCVEVCPTGSRKFGNLLDPASEIRYILENKRVVVLKNELNTRPQFFYFFG